MSVRQGYDNKMKVIQQLNRYNQFSRSEVFDKLYSQISNQYGHILTYQYQTGLSLNNIKSQIILLLDQKPNWSSFHQQYDVYLSTFELIAMTLQQQHSQAIQHSAQMALVIKSLDNNQMSWLRNQDELIEHSCHQLNRLNGKIKAQENEIDVSKMEIEYWKQQCFVKMIKFARELSEVNIKLKFNHERDLQVIQQYGSKCSEMNSYLYDTIPELQHSIHQRTQKVKHLQQKIANSINKTITSFNKAETGKILTLMQITRILGNQSGKPQEDCFFSIQLQRQAQNHSLKQEFSPMKHMKKTVDVTLHPHARNQTIIAHRQSLSSLCSELQQSGMRSDRMVVVEVAENTQELCESQILKQFCVIINDHLNKSEMLSPQQVSDFHEYLRDSFRSDKCRQVFLFFLYSKIKEQKSSLSSKQEDQYLRIINLCLQKSAACYDSQTIIKLILLALQIKSSQEGIQFYQRLDLHPFVDDFQFWETTFIETIFEYTEVMVNFYHLQLEQLKQEHTEAHRSFWDIFNPIKSLFKLHPIQEKAPTSMQELFPQIFKNVFTIYLSLMRVLGVPQSLQLMLRKRITLSFEKLQLNQHQKDYLYEKLNKLDGRDEDSLKSLLRNDIILDRALSKVIGTKGQGQQKPQDVSSLSRSIKEWEKGS